LNGNASENLTEGTGETTNVDKKKEGWLWDDENDCLLERREYMNDLNFLNMQAFVAHRVESMIRNLSEFRDIVLRTPDKSVLKTARSWETSFHQLDISDEAWMIRKRLSDLCAWDDELNPTSDSEEDEF